MFHVERRDIEAEMKCCSSNEQIFNGYGDSFCRLLAFNAAGELSNGERNRMDD